MKNWNIGLSWLIWIEGIRSGRIKPVIRSLAGMFLILSLLVLPFGAKAGFELDKRQLWPVLPSEQIQALVLEYHLIEHAPSNAKYPDLYVKPETFVKHISMFREVGLKCISFEEAIRQIHAGNFDSSNIVITFDDGYRDNYAAAILLADQKHGGSFFIPTFMVGRSQPANSLYYMSWADIKKISEMGFEIGSHSVHHNNLQNLSPKTVELEVSESISDILENIGKKPTTFSIPMGKYNNQVIDEIEKYGLVGCVTSRYGYLTKFNINNSPRIKILEQTGMRSVIMLYLSRNLKFLGDLKKGDVSSRVKSFRTMLTRIGHPLVDSDKFDDDMVKAVKEFQKFFQLEENGELNSTTMDRIINDFISLVVKGI
jgi:peptidoglycan/xylan/chitin deacetylase (PgdA/CDA1 family)